MKWIMASALVSTLSLAVSLTAQSGEGMTKADKMGKMDTPAKTYTGCVEAGKQAGTFTLTHLAAPDQMGKDGMKNDAMTKDNMKKDGMSKDNMAHDAMMPSALMLAGKSGDLQKHVGHKVTVTGASASDAMGTGVPTFTVKSVKMVSSSCS